VSTQSAPSTTKRTWWKSRPFIGLAGLVVGVGLANAGGDATPTAATAAAVATVPGPATTVMKTVTIPGPESTVVKTVKAVAAPAKTVTKIKTNTVTVMADAPQPPDPNVGADGSVDEAPLPLVDNGGGTSYANCSDVRAAGAAPIYSGDPGFQAKFDRDNDGVGCE